jgi:hypothetical protein
MGHPNSVHDFILVKNSSLLNKQINFVDLKIIYVIT